ncbi:MAG: hypothetical protein SFV52_09730 [Saprospiraceae bacterium]|nr:hypothetical protein [Saprospiraceae bacterium]
MSSSSHIDKQLRERLAEATAAPPPFVWVNIEARLRRRRRRRFLLWLAIGGTAGVVLYSLWLQFYPSGITTPAGPGAPVEGRHEPAASAASSPLTSPNLQASPNGGAIRPEHQPDETLRPSRPRTTGKGSALPRLPATTLLPQAVPGGAVTPSDASALSADNTTDVRMGSLDPLDQICSEQPVQKPELNSFAVAPPVRLKQKPDYCHPFRGTKPVWMFDAYAGPSFTNKQLSTHDSSGQALLEERLASESRDWGFHAGLRASVVLNRHFVVRSGLHYEQFVEQFEYVNPNSIQVLIRQTTQIIDNKPVTVTDTLDVLYGEEYTKTYNRFGLLDLPLEVGVEWRGRRSGLSLQGGASVNLLFWKSGNMLNEQLISEPINDITPAPFKDRVGLSIGGSAQWFYCLHPYTRLFVEPYYRQVIKPVSGPGYPLSQRYGFGGLRLGVTQVLY